MEKLENASERLREMGENSAPQPGTIQILLALFYEAGMATGPTVTLAIEIE